MPIFEITGEVIREVATTSFSAAGICERQDLQRLLRDKIEVIAGDVCLIAEEFGEWNDSKRRIDLLGVDKKARLVVIELKRTEDGGHMGTPSATVRGHGFDHDVREGRLHLCRFHRGRC